MECPQCRWCEYREETGRLECMLHKIAAVKRCPDFDYEPGTLEEGEPGEEA